MAELTRAELIKLIAANSGKKLILRGVDLTGLNFKLPVPG